MISVEASAAPSTGRAHRLRAPLALGAGVAAASAYVAAVDPNQAGHYPVCPFLAVTGLYCPGCGMLRATHDLLHLDLVGAVARNPLAPAVLGGMVVVWLAWVWSRWTGRRITWIPARATPWVIGAAVIVFTVARNVPGWAWLSPA